MHNDVINSFTVVALGLACASRAALYVRRSLAARNSCSAPAITMKTELSIRRIMFCGEKQWDNLVSPTSGAEGEGNGEVAQLDYLLWRQRFGQMIGGNSSAIGTVAPAAPEPASLLTLTTAAFACAALHRKPR
jgi:hypothetical protein